MSRLLEMPDEVRFARRAMTHQNLHTLAREYNAHRNIMEA